MAFSSSQPVDRISNMPETLIDDILMRLTTLEASKTRILSKQWRYKWAKLPHLIFDNELWKGLEWLQDPEEIEILNAISTMKFLLFLDQVLLHHEGPITKVSFIVPELESYSGVDRLIDFLSDHGVEDFTFELNMEYELPSSLFMYSKLKHLKLDSCSIDSPPPTFEGFNRLVRLELHSVVIDDKVIENLISSCPMLEHLVLSGCYQFEHFGIDAPMLKFLEFQCDSATICFKRTPCLETVKFKVYDSVARDELKQHGNCEFLEFFNSLPALRELSMDFYFIQVLAADQVQASLPALLIHLKSLKLSHIYLDELYQLSCFLSLIRSSPYLEELKITTYGWVAPIAPIVEFLQVQDFSNVLLNQLQKVKLLGIAGVDPEIALIKLLLEKSPKLESMVISYERGVQPNSIEGRKTVEEVNKLEAASPYAKVIHKFIM